VRQDDQLRRRDVDAVCQELAHAGLAARVMIDCSHANSQKQHDRQVDVARDVAARLAAVTRASLASDREPRQSRPAGSRGWPTLHYGISITDACIGWDATVDTLHMLAEAVRQCCWRDSSKLATLRFVARADDAAARLPPACAAYPP